MKRNEILGEHKKGIKAVKYNAKPKNPADEHAKAKEKLKPIKPMESRYGYNKYGYDDSGMSLRPGNDEGPDSWDYSAAHDRIGAGDPRRPRRHEPASDVPHDVHINGRKWKTFGSKSHAENVARKLAANGKTVHVKASLTDEAAGDPVGTVSSATPDGKVSIKTDTGSEIQTSKDALIPGANGTLQMKPDAAGDALKPGAKVVSTEDFGTPPGTDSTSPINGDEENTDLRRLRELAGQPAASAPDQPAAAPGTDIDPGEEILNIASNNPEVKNFIEASTVRDADGDVDFAGTMGKMMTSASEQMDIKGLQDAVVQMEAKFKAFPSSPEFKALTPEEQQEWTQAAPEGLKLMQDLVAQFAKMQQSFAAGGKQLTNFSQSPDAPKDNPMKGVKSFIPQKPAQPPMSEELKAMLSIAGLR